MQKLHNALLIITALFIIFYWVSVFTGLFPVTELVPGYQNWFMSFPIPDFYVAGCASITIISSLKNKKVSALFGAMTGSALLFLGLYAFAYGFNSGLIYNLTPEEIIEIAIKIYCLTVGTFFVFMSWQLIRS